MEVLKTRKAIFFADRVQLIGFGNVAAAAAGGGRAFPPVFCFGAVRVSFAAAFQFADGVALSPFSDLRVFRRERPGIFLFLFVSSGCPRRPKKCFCRPYRTAFFVLTGYRPGGRTRWPQPCPLPFIRGIIRLSRLKRRAGFVTEVGKAKNGVYIHLKMVHITLYSIRKYFI